MVEWYEREVGKLLGMLLECGAQHVQAVDAVLDEARLLRRKRERRGGHHCGRTSERSGRGRHLQ